MSGVKIEKRVDDHLSAEPVEGKPYNLALDLLANELIGTLGDLKAQRSKRGADLHKHTSSLARLTDSLLKQIKLEMEIAQSRAAVVQRQPDEVIAGRLKAGLAEQFPKEVVVSVLSALGLPYPEE